MAARLSFYDTNDYLMDYPLYSVRNKKVLSKMKDECCGRSTKEYLGLHPKMYSILEANGRGIKKAKGVKKAVVKSDLPPELYGEVLLQKRTFRHSLDTLQSEKHQIYGQHLNKLSLPPFDSNGMDRGKRSGHTCLWPQGSDPLQVRCKRHRDGCFHR